MREICTQPWKFGYLGSSFLLPSGFLTENGLSPWHCIVLYWRAAPSSGKICFAPVLGPRKVLRQSGKPCAPMLNQVLHDREEVLLKAGVLILSHIALWDGPLKYTLCNGTCFKGVGLSHWTESGKDVKTKQECKPGMSSSTQYLYSPPPPPRTHTQQIANVRFVNSH